MLSFFCFCFKGVDIANNPDDSSSMIHMESEMMDSNLGK